MGSSKDIDLELKAIEFRQKNGLSQNEAIRLKSVLLKENILAVFLPLSKEFSGMAVRTENKSEIKRFILINSAHTLGRQHFTICHELYHLFYQDDFKSEKTIACKFDKKNYPEEYYADVFASNLLLPTNGVMQLIPAQERIKNQISLRTILAIEQYYSCSRNALLNKLERLKIADQTYLKQFKSNIIKNALLHGYNTDLYLFGNEGVIIGDYGSNASELFERGDISESAYFSLLEDIGIDLSNYEQPS